VTPAFLDQFKLAYQHAKSIADKCAAAASLKATERRGQENDTEDELGEEAASDEDDKDQAAQSSKYIPTIQTGMPR